MRIAITGATGMIGSKLTAYLLANGHQITVITRRNTLRTESPGIAVIVWDPSLEYIEIEKLEGFDVIIHLAGNNIGEYWTEEYKKSILKSRVESTKLLCKSLSKVISKPKIVICASAVGFYGNHPSTDLVDENSPSGTGFLANVCRQWEEVSFPLRKEGIRTVHMRLGVILSKSGGALAKMLTPFQLGLGGRLGNGQQMLSWIALDEIPYVVEHIIKDNLLLGGVNVVSPQAVSNARFTEILGQVIHRPTFLPCPGFMVRLFFGEMGQQLLLEGVNVIPRRLQQSGYQFRFPELKAVLEKVVK